MSDFPPSLDEYPVGPLIAKARTRMGLSVRDVFERIQDLVMDQGLSSGFKNQASLYRAEKLRSIGNPDDLKILCTALDLPWERYRRRNLAPILLDGIMKDSHRSDEAVLYCQPSVYDPIEQRASLEVMEVLVTYFFQSQGSIVLVKRNFDHVFTSLISSAVLLASKSFEAKPTESEIDSAIRKVRQARSGRKLRIPYLSEALHQILKRITIYRLKDAKSLMRSISRHSPTTYWYATDGSRSSGYVSLGDHAFLQCGAKDVEHLEERFKLIQDDKAPYEKIIPSQARHVEEMIKNASDRMNLAFVSVKSGG